MFKWIERRDYRGWVVKEPGPLSLEGITEAKKEAAEIMSGCQGPDAPAYVQAKAIWDLLDDQFQIALVKEVGPMARRAVQPPQPPEIRQFRTTGEIDATIVKLRRRVADIEKLRSDNVRHDDARVDNVEHSVRDTIREEFGKDSPEFQRHAGFKIDDTPPTMRLDYFGSGGRNFDAEDQRKFAGQISGAITRVDDLVRRLEERRADLAEPTIAPRVALASRTLNPAIANAATKLYLDGHYAQAVFEAGKALIALVKVKSGKADLDGAPLMQSVFSVNNPILAFSTLADQSDRDEQQGMMTLYAGAVLAIRNPGGHRVGVIEQPDRALQHLELLSYLADRLDETKKVR